MQGTFDARYPNRKVAILVATVTQSPSPSWDKIIGDADLELRFELNYAIGTGEPNRLLVSPGTPNIAIFQLNLLAFDQNFANRMIPDFLHTYYPNASQLTSLLSLALIDHLYKNRGDSLQDQNRINTLINPLRQYVLTVLLNETLNVNSDDYASSMVGVERIKDLFRQLCRKLYPNYVTLMTSPKWQENLQQYKYALESIIADDNLSVARGKRPWEITKEQLVYALRIPGKRLTNLDPLLDALGDLIEKVSFSGRTPTSPVILQFKLHPLEEEVLGKFDGTTKTLYRNGDNLSAVVGTELIREANKLGYTFEEIKEVIALLQLRRYITFDPKQDLMLRTIDSTDELQESISERLNKLAHNLQMLVDAVPEFDTSRFPISKFHYRTLFGMEFM